MSLDTTHAEEVVTSAIVDIDYFHEKYDRYPMQSGIVLAKVLHRLQELRDDMAGEDFDHFDELATGTGQLETTVRMLQSEDRDSFKRGYRVANGLKSIEDSLEPIIHEELLDRIYESSEVSKPSHR